MAAVAVPIGVGAAPPNPVQQVKDAVAIYIADPQGEPRAKQLLELQQTIIQTQEGLLAAVTANMQGLLQREVGPLRNRVAQLEKHQGTNQVVTFVAGCGVGALAYHFISRALKA